MVGIEEVEALYEKIYGREEKCRRAFSRGKKDARQLSSPNDPVAQSACAVAASVSADRDRRRRLHSGHVVSADSTPLPSYFSRDRSEREMASGISREDPSVHGVWGPVGGVSVETSGHLSTRAKSTNS